jgi:DNA-binding transcriptional LysR family regulator
MQNSMFNPQSLDISSLESFLALAQTKSFSKAAEKINKSQSAVSQQIAKLETTLKCHLINREKNNALTEKGEVLYSYASKILKIHQEALNYFINPELKGEIRFGLPEDFATVFLAEILSEFNIKYPNILINVECDLTLHLLKRFHKKQFDLVMVKTTSREEIPCEFEIWDEKLVWVSKENSNIDLFATSLPLVLSPKPCVYRARALEGLVKNGIKHRIVYTSPSFIGSVAAVRADMGITVMPQNMIPEGLEEISSDLLPDLDQTHVSLLLKNNAPSSAISFADYIFKRLKH